MEAHPSGALWLPEQRTAILADVHLGYSWAQRRRGELGPLADFETRKKLLALAADLQPDTLVFLGDLVHAPRPCAPEREWVEALLGELAANSKLVAVRGNHDRAFAREFSHLPVTMVEFWSNELLIAVHGDKLEHAPAAEGRALVLGHFHQCLGVRDAAGAGQNLPLFLASEGCVVLPAFSPFARGYDLACGLPSELHGCLGRGTLHAFAVTGKRVAQLGPLRAAMEKMWDADRSAPARFRRRSASF